jgi:phosphoribosylformylglycinamidine synthase, purS protein
LGFSPKAVRATSRARTSCNEAPWPGARVKPMRARVHISYKVGVLDPQGKAIARALANLGFKGVLEVRQGKLIEIDLDGADPASAQGRVVDMCEKLLANTVIEDYVVEIDADAPPRSQLLAGGA